jgi:hypothetical protein
MGGTLPGHLNTSKAANSCSFLNHFKKSGGHIVPLEPFGGLDNHRGYGIMDLFESRTGMDKEAERTIIAVRIDAVLTIIQKVAKCRKNDTKKSRKVLDNVRIL